MLANFVSFRSKWQKHFISVRLLRQNKHILLSNATWITTMDFQRLKNRTSMSKFTADLSPFRQGRVDAGWPSIKCVQDSWTKARSIGPNPRHGWPNRPNPAMCKVNGTNKAIDHLSFHISFRIISCFTIFLLI